MRHWTASQAGRSGVMGYGAAGQRGNAVKQITVGDGQDAAMGFKDHERAPWWARILKFVLWVVGLTTLALPLMLLLTDL